MNWTTPSQLLLFFCLVSLSRPVPADRAQPGVQTSTYDYPSLSGTWAGTLSILKRNDCEIAGSAISIRHVRFVLNVGSDGSFRAGPSPRGAKDVLKFPWRGQFKPDLTSVVIAPSHSLCGEHRVRREYQIKLLGKVTNKEGRYQLEFEGNDPACPDTNCIFLRMYKLTKE
jgi:hypothetical protein